MEYPEYKTLTVVRDGAILHLILNRPELSNAANAEMENELACFFTDVNRDRETRVVILNGNGKAFSAGGDFTYIRELLDDPSKAWDGIQQSKRVIFALLDCIKPVLAKINGHAIGFGATLALFCDVTFAANHVKIADPHVALGFVAGDGGALIWPQLVGCNRAKEYLFTGESLSAEEAARIGLINHAIPAAELDAKVQAYASKVAAMPPRAVQWTKASTNIGLKPIMDASMAYEALSNSTHDHREALDAIRDKRKPQFNGN